MPPKYNGTACKTCRRRGRKCTRELPKCQSCLNKGIECEGYTLRWAGLASRGRLAGKTTLEEPESSPTTSSLGQTSPTTSTSSSPTVIETQLITTQSFVNNSLDNPPENIIRETVHALLTPGGLVEDTDQDFDVGFPTNEQNVGDEVDESYQDHRVLQSSTDMTLYQNPLEFCTIPSELKFILNYHLLEVAPRLCVDNASVRNPYSQYIFPLAVQRPPLLYACAALAACHFSVRLSNPKYLIDSLKFRGKAMRRLQECLWSEQSAKDEGNLSSVLMLTLTDMCLGGPSNFDAHFKAAKSLIDLRGPEKTRDSFVEQYIAWLDIMSAASNNRTPLFTSEDVSKLTGPTQTWSHDVFPCPPDQFSVISEIVKLYKSQDDPTQPSPVTLSTAEAYKAQLLVQPMHTERGEPWLHLTEAYRHAIALYIIRLFNCSTDEDEVAWLTQSVFYHAKSTPPLTGWSDQLLWPLFHAGLEVRDERRKEWLRERARVMQQSGGFGNVATAMAILEKVWASDNPPCYMNLLRENDSADIMFV